VSAALEPAVASWDDLNQQALIDALAGVRSTLEQHARAVRPTQEASGQDPSKQVETRHQRLVGAPLGAADRAALPSALDVLASAFALTPFEQQILVMCVGIELDASFAFVCAAASGDPDRTAPTFGLALAALPDAHWDALLPTAPLRHWRLIEPQSGAGLTAAPLRVDERVLHFLTGVEASDAQLAGLLTPVEGAGPLAPSHARLAARLAATLADPPEPGPGLVVQLYGEDVRARTAIARAGSAMAGLGLLRLVADALPAAPADIDLLARLCEREARLTASAILVATDDIDTGDAPRSVAARRFIGSCRAPLIVTARDRIQLDRSPVTIDVARPGIGEQLELWRAALETIGHAETSLIERLAGQFSFGAAEIVDAVATAAASEDDVPSAVWSACRLEARPSMEGLAQRIGHKATWRELVLPPAQIETLGEIGIQVRQRARVYDTWGFGRSGERGLGISALFAGPSGTGKTLAAEVLAEELQLDLYRIDLSQVVSKYIGETEKNLRRVFDAAEIGGAVLLFDEADAIFGKRSEVKDSHDRYANIEVSYLLQRMEAYRGLAILTTNQKSALDAAFLRRIRFVVDFPFPDELQRAEIWRRVFPADAPTSGLDWRLLAQLHVSGGSIRNIALNSAFIAAEADEPVGMQHLARAARTEYAKLEKPMTTSELRGWA
jgi:hypothetical protein